MAIREKYYNSDRFRGVENLDSLYERRIRSRNVTRTDNPTD